MGKKTYTLEECKRLARAEFDSSVDYLEVLKAMIGCIFVKPNNTTKHSKDTLKKKC